MSRTLDRRATLALEPRPESAAAARRFLREQLESWGAGGLVDDAVLALSELVTNAIIHARSPISVVVELGDDRLRVEVHDRSARPVLLDSVVAGVVDDGRGGPAGAAEHQRTLDEQPSTGRGLFIVASLAAAVGERLDHDGKTVWFELDPKLDDAAGPMDDAAGPMVVQAPRAGAEAPAVPIRLMGLVPAVVIAADAHLDDLLRELPLVRGEDQAAAEAVVDCAHEVTAAHPDLERLADAARLAVSRGRDRFDITLELAPTAVDHVETLHRLVRAVQRLCAAGVVLTLPASEAVLDYWSWMGRELRRQLVDGADPTAYVDSIRPS